MSKHLLTSEESSECQKLTKNKNKEKNKNTAANSIVVNGSPQLERLPQA